MHRRRRSRGGGLSTYSGFREGDHHFTDRIISHVDGHLFPVRELEHQHVPHGSARQVELLIHGHDLYKKPHGYLGVGGSGCGGGVGFGAIFTNALAMMTACLPRRCALMSR